MNRQSDVPNAQRRQMLMGAAVAGIAPLLLSACGSKQGEGQASTPIPAPTAPAAPSGTARAARLRDATWGPSRSFRSAWASSGTRGKAPMW